MTTATQTYPAQLAYVPQRAGTLYDVLELILDRGMVIDVFVRVSLVGIEILKIDARVVVASVDTYLRFAEACNRLDLETDTRSTTVPELFGGGGIGRKVAKKGAKKAVSSAGQKVRDVLTGGSDEEDQDDEDQYEDSDAAEEYDEPEEQEEQEAPRRRASARRSAPSSAGDERSKARRRVAR